MINGHVSGNSNLDAVWPRLSTKLDRTIGRLAINLASRVKVKLSGEVLKNRTGRLRRSITQKVTGAGTPQVSGVVGTNVPYARAHELGFKGVVTVREHLRMQTMAFGKAMANPRQVIVSQHSMKMNLPERSFLRSALAEFDPTIRQEIAKAIQEVTQP